MYLPKHFDQDDPARLHALMRDFPLATLVTQGEDGPEANHIPLLLHPDEGPHGTLYGHFARANPQWRIAGPALAVFQGGQAYVSPSWYASKAEHGKAVPTWNYVAVHASGPLEIVEDAERLRSLLAELTAIHETGMPHPWTLEDAPPDYLAAMMKAVVGFRLPIAKLQGKWKLSQNRDEADREGVRRHLPWMD